MNNLIIESNHPLISRFECAGNKVRAVFFTKKDMINYIEKYSPFSYSDQWYDEIAFADFKIEADNVISSSSTYHSQKSIIRIFEKGLNRIT